MASDLKKERDELQQELYRVSENERLYRNLAENRAKLINTLGTELQQEKDTNANLRESYDDLLARFNAREGDFARVQKEVEIQKARADQNYQVNQDERSVIVKQKGV